MGQARIVLRVSTYDKKNPDSVSSRKENPIALRISTRPTWQETTQEEYCENCGPRDGLEARAVWAVHGLHGYPDCKTTRRMDQGKKVPDIPLDEKVPEVRPQFNLRHGRYGEFNSCSAILSASTSSRTSLG